jgi:hypothetical protein
VDANKRNRGFSRVAVTIIVLLISAQLEILSQENPECDIAFINHLVRNSMYEEALFMIESSECSLMKDNDSIMYMKGWSLYSLSRYSTATQNFLMVSHSSLLYPKARFYAAYNCTLSSDYGAAEEILKSTILENDSYVTMRNIQLAGIELLKGDVVAFDRITAKIRMADSGLREPYGRLMGSSVDLRIHRTKSPLLAGMMSGLIPGSGKYYAGMKGQALTAFLATTGLGFVTWENYSRNGLKNFQTILFGSAFVVTYVSNIYGAVFSVRIVENAFRENVEKTVLVNMHIPLSFIFGE